MLKKVRELTRGIKTGNPSKLERLFNLFNFVKCTGHLEKARNWRMFKRNTERTRDKLPQ